MSGKSSMAPPMWFLHKNEPREIKKSSKHLIHYFRDRTQEIEKYWDRIVNVTKEYINKFSEQSSILFMFIAQMIFLINAYHDSDQWNAIVLTSAFFDENRRFIFDNIFMDEWYKLPETERESISNPTVLTLELICMFYKHNVEKELMPKSFRFFKEKITSLNKYRNFEESTYSISILARFQWYYTCCKAKDIEIALRIIRTEIEPRGMLKRYTPDHSPTNQQLAKKNARIETLKNSAIEAFNNLNTCPDNKKGQNIKVIAKYLHNLMLSLICLVPRVAGHPE